MPLTLQLPAKDVFLLLQGAAHLPHNIVDAVLKTAHAQIQSQLEVHAAMSKELGDRKGVAPPIAP
jgi:hypothetical protein